MPHDGLSECIVGFAGPIVHTIPHDGFSEWIGLFGPIVQAMPHDPPRE